MSFMPFRTILLIALCAGFMSCKKGVEPEPVNDYPMAAGDTWTYAGVDSAYNFRPSVPGMTYQMTSEPWIHHVRVVGLQTLPDSTHAWQLQSAESTYSWNATVDQYYRLEHDTLKFVAYSGFTSSALPKRSPQFMYLFQGRKAQTVADLAAPFRLQLPAPARVQSDFTMLADPGRVLLLPLSVGKQWRYNAEGAAFFPVWKKIVGTESVGTPAGTFVCFTIQWLWDMNNDGKMDTDIGEVEYVCPKGLIKRVLTLKNITIADADHPEGFGMIDIMMIKTVTMVNTHSANEL